MQEENYIGKIQEIEQEMISLYEKRRAVCQEMAGGPLPVEQSPYAGFTPVPELVSRGRTAAYCGVPGAFAYEAVIRFFGEEIEPLSVGSFDAAMAAIASGQAQYAVLPIENSTAGAVGNVYDLLKEYDHTIVGELDLSVCHNLLVVPGTKISEIREVYSHPQALSQCRHYLDEEHPKWLQIPGVNTAVCAKEVSEEGDRRKAAIGSEDAARLYGLEVLQRRINRTDTNTTRFVVVSGEKIYLESAKKVRVCFECLHRTGTLYHLLAHIAFNSLNMTRIESRPIPEQSGPKQNWEYRFFVDFKGNLQDENVRRALDGLKLDARALRILGNC